MHYWLMKTEPSTFSYQDLEREGWTHWDGVRNHQAQKNMRAMKKDDLVLIYHSVVDKELVGLAKVIEENYPDPTDPTGKWGCVKLAPVKPLKQRVSLQDVKETPELAEIPLIRQSRLSVMPLEKENFNKLLEMADTCL